MRIFTISTIAILLLVTLMHTACNNNNLIKIEGTSTIFIDTCIHTIANELIIDDSNTYNSLLDSSNCNNYQLPYIDFAEYSLIAKYTVGLGCTAFYKREVFADTETQQYIYQISADIDSINCGNDFVTHEHFNWLKVPKLPSNYAVTFEVVYN